MRVPAGVRIGVAGVALALVVMMLSLAIVTGFKQEIRRKVLGYESQVTVHGKAYAQSDGTAVLELTPELLDDVRQSLGLVHVSPVADLPALLKTDTAFSALVIRAVGPEFDRSFISRNIIEGSWQSTDSVQGIAISATTASDLSLSLGDRVYVHFFRNDAISTRRLTIQAIYDTNFDDYDRHFAFADMQLARSVAKLDSTQCTALLIDGLPPDTDTRAAASALSSAIVHRAVSSGGDPVSIPTVTDVSQTGALYLNWLDLLDTNVVVILSLMAVVAGFTLISSLFILILERVPMIGILKAMGATNGQIRRIFIWLAEKIVLKGVVIGNAVGLAAYLLQHWLRVVPLNPEAYYLSYVPTQLSAGTWIALNAAVIAGSVLVLVLPSMVVARMSPAESLRSESTTDL